MGMQLTGLTSTAGAEPLMDLNTTPLIDVMLVLLVMLIVTLPMQLHSVSLTIGGEPPDRVPVVHRVGIDFDGALSWDGQPLANSAALEARLRDIGTGPAATQPQVQIQPNRLVDYGRVAHVMSTAQRSGVVNMGVLGNEAFVK